MIYEISKIMVHIQADPLVTNLIPNTTDDISLRIKIKPGGRNAWNGRDAGSFVLLRLCL